MYPIRRVINRWKWGGAVSALDYTLYKHFSSSHSPSFVETLFCSFPENCSNLILDLLRILSSKLHLPPPKKKYIYIEIIVRLIYQSRSVLLWVWETQAYWDIKTAISEVWSPCYLGTTVLVHHDCHGAVAASELLRPRHRGCTVRRRDLL